MAYPTVTGYDSDLLTLQSTFPAICTRIRLSNKTHEGRDVFALRISSSSTSDPERPAVLIVGGLHAREWAPPDALLTFVISLVNAYANSSTMILPRFVDRKPFLSIVYPEIILSWPAIRDIVDYLDIYVVPMANPDGRVHSHNVNFWRKNRRPSSATCSHRTLPDYLDPDHPDFELKYIGIESPKGVDVNRNFGKPQISSPPSGDYVLWDFEEYYSPAGEQDAGVSKDECDIHQLYVGPDAGSEPETKNIQELIEDKQVRWFLDVHSFARLVLIPWGTEVNGSNSAQTFQEPDWNRSGTHGGRDGKGTTYSEFVPDNAPEMLQSSLNHNAQTIRLGILRCAGKFPFPDPRAAIRSFYQVDQPINLIYAATGSSMDYAFSKQFLPGDWGPVYAFTIECGSDQDDEGGFHPSTRIYPKIEREIHAGVFTFLHLAANQAIRSSAPPPRPNVPPPSPGP